MLPLSLVYAFLVRRRGGTLKGTLRAGACAASRVV